MCYLTQDIFYLPYSTSLQDRGSNEIIYYPTLTMKKHLTILAILFLVSPSFAQLPCMSQLKIEVDLSPNTGSYDAMGLVLGHIHVINLDTVPVEISIYGDKIVNLKMESDITWIRLEGCIDNALAEWQDIMVSVPPSDTFDFTFNFNILDFVLKNTKPTPP